MIRVPVPWIDWFDLPRSLATIGIVGGGFLLWSVGGHRSPFALLAVAPVVAVVLAVPLIGFVLGFRRWVHERTWAPWHGRYHAFDDRQVRVVEARGTLWFSAADVQAALSSKQRPGVLRSLGPAERRDDADLGVVLSNAGLVRVFGSSTDRSVLRFLAWAERDVRRPWQNKRDANVA